MNSMAMIAVLSLGQMGAVDPCGYSVRVGPTTYIDYLYGTMQVQSKYDVEIRYSDGRIWRVPVVNGYVPRINVTNLSDGGVRYVLDYRCRIPYDPPKPPRPVSEPEPELKSVVRPKLVPKLVPKLEPLPTPVPKLKLEPMPKLKPMLPIPESKPEPEILPFGMSRPSDVAEPSKLVQPRYEKVDDQ